MMGVSDSVQASALHEETYDLIKINEIFGDTIDEDDSYLLWQICNFFAIYITIEIIEILKRCNLK